MVSTNNDALLLRAQKSKATTSTLDVPMPAGRVLFPYQIAGVEFALESKHTFFADPPGLGKTAQSIAFMNKVGLDSALIICPASLVHNWKREILKWHVAPKRVEIFHPKRFSGTRSGFLIFPYSQLSNLFWASRVMKLGPWPLTIFDESHFLKNPKAHRTKHALARNGIFGASERVHALSGTPIVNRPIELYPLVKTIAPEAIKNMDYVQFGCRYCAGFLQEIRGRKHWNFTGASNLNELALRLRSSVMVRRNKEDVLKDLPDKIQAVVYLDTNKQAQGANSRVSPLLYDPKQFDVSLKHDFTELAEARRELGVLKSPQAVEYIKTQLEAGHEKIVVFAHHKEVVSVLKKELAQYNPVTLTGETQSLDRQRAVDLFQENKEVRVFIGSITASGVGITLTASSYVIFVEPSWVPGENEQAMDRCHRIGQKKSVLVDFLVFEGTLDEYMLRIVSEKSKVINQLTKGEEYETTRASGV